MYNPLKGVASEAFSPMKKLSVSANNTLVDISNMSYLASSAWGAGAGATIGAVNGAFSYDGSFVGGAFQGAMLGAGVGAGLRFGAEGYATGAGAKLADGTFAKNNQNFAWKYVREGFQTEPTKN